MTDDLLIHGGRVLDLEGFCESDVLIRDGKVDQVGPGLNCPEGVTRLNAKGKIVMPGCVDPQVHFREPGLEHKEDLFTGGLSAIAGGVTSFMEMPNTNPLTIDPEALADKISRAKLRSPSDFAFFVGATADNADRLAEYEGLPGCAGVKIFMGSSTGDLLVRDDATLERVLRSGERRVAVHSEDDFRLRERYANLPADISVREHPDVRDIECATRATTRLLDLVEKTGRKIHLLHVSTAEEISMLRERDLGDLVTAEVTPNHLFLAAPDCYEQYGSLVQMNPPVRALRHRDALRGALADGTICCFGSDHAPHILEEKQKPYPSCPSGIPGVQTTLPLALTAIRDGWLRWSDLVRVTSQGAVDVYGIQGKGVLRPGTDGDVVIIDPDIRTALPLEWLRSRAAYSPYVGRQLAGWPEATILRGQVAYRKHKLIGSSRGEPIRFSS